MNLVPSILFIGILLFSLISFFVNTNAQELKPNALISPTCSDIVGSRINLHVNGFEPDSNVGWKLVNPETQTISEYGYFTTNSTGGFSESAFIEQEDGELVEGNYEIQFFDDADTDGNPDSGKTEFIELMSVPCE